jgi:hypothetical protein
MGDLTDSPAALTFAPATRLPQIPGDACHGRSHAASHADTASQASRNLAGVIISG